MENKNSKDDMTVLRFDFVFSYWIFVWWILYKLGLVKQNPKFIIILAIIYILVSILGNINKKPSCYFLPLIISSCIIKFYPLFSLRETEIESSDVIFSFQFVLMYLFWLLVNDGVEEVFNFYFSNDNNNNNVRPPFEYYFNKFFEIKC